MLENKRVSTESPDVSAYRPRVFDYDCYRSFLRDVSNYFKNSKGLSIREFSKLLGFSSLGYLSALARKERHLSVHLGKLVASRLSMNADEAAYFLTLIQWEKAEAQEKIKLQALLETLRDRRETKILSETELHLFANWLAVCILELLSQDDCRHVTLESLVEKVREPRQKIFEALELLQNLNLVTKEGNFFSRTASTVSTAAEIPNEIVRAFHQENFRRAAKRLEQCDVSERFAGGLTLSLTKDEVLEARELLFQFQKKLNDHFSRRSGRREVHQICISLTPAFEPNLEDPEN